MGWGGLKNISKAITKPFQQAAHGVSSLASKPLAQVSNLGAGVSRAVAPVGKAFGTVGNAASAAVNPMLGGIRSLQQTGEAIGPALNKTFSKDILKNPAEVGSAWSDVGRSATSPFVRAIESTGAGKNLTNFARAHQPETYFGLSGGALGVGQALNAGRESLIAAPKRQAEMAATAEEQAAHNLENQQNALISQVRGQFGSTGIGQQRNALMQAARQQAQRQADIGFGNSLTQQRINAARSGQTGSSTDQSANSGLLANYYNTLAQGAVGASQAGQGFDEALQQQRIQTENAIRGSNVNDLSGMRGDLASLMNAAGRGQISQNALANFLPTLAQTGSNYFQAKAFGGT